MQERGWQTLQLGTLLLLLVLRTNAYSSTQRGSTMAFSLVPALRPARLCSMGWTMRHSSERQTLCCASERDLVVVPLLDGDHYSTLSVPFTASDGQIQAAFRKLVPTGHRTQMQASYLNSVIAAYTVLSDPVLRKKYDRKQPFDHDGHYLHMYSASQELEKIIATLRNRCFRRCERCGCHTSQLRTCDCCGARLISTEAD